ncbi:MAG: chromate transporter [Dethiobacteria bacterium]|jgi:chromate transporter
MKNSPKKNKNNSAKKITLSELFFTFFKIGAFTFGGGYAMIPLIKREIAEKKNWIGNNEFLDNLAVAQSLPGSNVISFSLLVGYRLKGIKGGFFSLLGTILPSFLIILIISIFLWQFRKNDLVQAAFYGIRPAVVALIISAAYELGKGVFRQRRSLLLFILFFGVLILFNLHPLVVIVSGAITGFLWTNKK